MGRSLATRPAAAAPLLAVLLLGPRHASAGFDLGKFTPRDVIDQVKNSDPQKIAEQLADKHPTDIASKVLKGEDAAHAVKQAGEAAGQLKHTAQSTVAGVLQGAGANATPATSGSGPQDAAQSAAKTTATERRFAKPTDGDTHKAKVLDTLEAVHDALHQATDVVNQTAPGVINGTNPVKLAKALKDQAQDVAADAAKDPSKALETAKNVIEKVPQGDAIKSAAADLAKAFNFGGHSKHVEKVIEKAKPQVSDVLGDAHKAVKQASTDDVTKVAHAISTGNPDKVQDAFRGGRPGGKGPHGAGLVDKAAAQGGLGGRWLLMGVLLVGGAAFGGWQLFKHRDVRSPTLLMETEMWGGGESCGRMAPSPEEPLYGRF